MVVVGWCLGEEYSSWSSEDVLWSGGEPVTKVWVCCKGSLAGEQW